MNSPVTALLDTNIKDIIRTNQAVGEILEAHGIACVTCGVGTCLLKDIIDIHALAADEVHAVLTEIAAVVFPGQQVEIPRVETRQQSRPASLSPPIRKLMDEHVHIKRLVGLIPLLVDCLQQDPVSGRQLIQEAVAFVAAYADRYHHAKEEDILFGHFDENAEIFRVMREDHVTARGYVAAIRAALEVDDDETAASKLTAYAALLTEHIRKEDEVLFPWMDRNLSMRQVGELYARFADVDAQFGDDPPRRIACLDEIEAASSRGACDHTVTT
jgi:hemerythrin-like domain-containing protein